MKATYSQVNALREALIVRYGSRQYRITHTGEVHVNSKMPNSNTYGWWLLGDIDHVIKTLAA